MSRRPPDQREASEGVPGERILARLDDELAAAAASLDAASDRLTACDQDSDLEFERIVIAHLATEARDIASAAARHLIDMEGGPLVGGLHSQGRTRFEQAQALLDTSTEVLAQLDHVIADCRRAALLHSIAENRHLALTKLNAVGWELRRLTALSDLVAALAALTSGRDMVRNAQKATRDLLDDADLPPQLRSDIALTRKELAAIDRRALRALHACASRLVQVYAT